MGKKKKDNEALLKGVQASIKSAQETVKSATKSMQQSAETLRAANPKTNVANTNTTKTTQGSSVNIGELPKLGTITSSGTDSNPYAVPYLSMPSAPKSTAAPSALITAAEKVGAAAQAAAQRVTQNRAQPTITLDVTNKNAAATQATKNLMFPAIGTLPLNSDAQDGKTKLLRNSTLWHTTDDPAEKARLKAENDTIRARNNWTYEPGSGATMAAREGLPLSKTDNLTLPVIQQFGTFAQRTAADEAQAQARTPDAIAKRIDAFQTNEALEEAAKEVAYKYGMDFGKPKNENDALEAYFQHEEERLREYGISESELKETMENSRSYKTENGASFSKKTNRNSILWDLRRKHTFPLGFKPQCCRTRGA